MLSRLSLSIKLLLWAALLVVGVAEERSLHSGKHLRHEADTSLTEEEEETNSAAGVGMDVTADADFVETTSESKGKRKSEEDTAGSDPLISGSIYKSWSSKAETGKESKEVHSSRTIEESVSSGSHGEVKRHRKETICKEGNCKTTVSESDGKEAKRITRQDGSVAFEEMEDPDFLDQEKNFLNEERKSRERPNAVVSDAVADVPYERSDPAVASENALEETDEDEVVMVPVRKRDLMEVGHGTNTPASHRRDRHRKSHGAKVPVGAVVTRSVSETAGLTPDGRLVHKVTECNGRDCVTQVSTGRLAGPTRQVKGVTHQVQGAMPTAKKKRQQKVQEMAFKEEHSAEDAEDSEDSEEHFTENH